MLSKMDHQVNLAEKYCTEYLAAVEYQCRLNSFMVSSMHQTIPQRPVSSSDGLPNTESCTVHSTKSIPDAAFRWLLCTPPFTAVLSRYADTSFLFRFKHHSTNDKFNQLSQSRA